MEEKKILNNEELEKVNGGLGDRVCIKDSSNISANQSFCSGCSAVRRTPSYSGRGYECTCGKGVSGVWKE